MAKVAINELTLNTVRTTPLIKPIKKQKENTAKKPKKILPLIFITSITIMYK